MCDNCLCRCATLVIGFILLIGGCVGVVFFGFHVAKPFIDTVHFTEAECKVTEVRDLGFMTCKCGTECQSVFPCKTVLVRLKTDSQEANSTLYRDGETLESYNDKKCSSSFCRRNHELNAEAVQDFLSEYGLIGNEYSCFFNPDNHSEVIAEKYGWISLGLFMGIPTGCLIIGLILIISGCKGC